jgi:hypothetical protein
MVPGGALTVTASQPVRVYAAPRVDPVDPTYNKALCADFTYAGFNRDETIRSTVGPDASDYFYSFQRRDYKLGGTFSLPYNVTSRPGFNPAQCGGSTAVAFSWFVVLPLRGQSSCPWTPWTLPSKPLPVLSRCPYTQNGKCNLHGVCNETDGSCKCDMSSSSWGGVECSKRLGVGMCKCVGDPHCTTADGNYFDYYGGGEMVLLL